MIKVSNEGIILEKTEIVFENEGVLNPGMIKDGEWIHMFYRAVSTGNYSSIGHCTLSDPLTIRLRDEKAAISPEFDYESHGVEDPRIVKIDDLFYLTYTAFDGVNAMGALAVSKDLLQFEKLGLIVPLIPYDYFNHLVNTKVLVNEKYIRYNQQNQSVDDKGRKRLIWDKNVIFFPRRINGKLTFLHRIRPDIQIVSVDAISDLTQGFWREYFLNFTDHILLKSHYEHEVSYIGGGCPPIETEHGWLLIYHGVHDTIEGYMYTACAALLSNEDVPKEIARLPYPLFKPEHDWEKSGIVNNVCFPTGAIVAGDTLYIYYGAADEQIACASMSLSGLLSELLLNRTANVE